MSRDSCRTTRLGEVITDAIDEEVLIGNDPRASDPSSTPTEQRLQRGTGGRRDDPSRESSMQAPEAKR